MHGVDAIGWHPSDYDLFLELARDGRFEAEDLAAVMATESELRHCSPNTAGSGARGLTSLMPDTLRGLGWRAGDPAHDAAGGDFCAAPVYVQLQYAAKYFAEWRSRFRLARWTSRTQMFLANFLPAELPHARDPQWVVAGQGKRELVVTQNTAMDRNRDGAINVAEVAAFVDDAVRTRARARYLTALGGIALARARGGRREDDEPPSSSPPGLREPSDIRGVQVALSALGYAPGPFDGLRGQLTRTAVAAFQRNCGMAVDGVVGPVTWLALSRAMTALQSETPDPSA
jgi:hypothetical protein